MELERLLGLKEGINYLTDTQRNLYYRGRKFELVFTNDDFVNSRNPSGYDVNWDYWNVFMLQVLVYNRSPKEFIDILVVHELKEADLVFHEGMTTHEAHIVTVPIHLEYAHKYLSEKDYKRFLDWDYKIKLNASAGI